MKGPVLVDTGPLVAIRNEDDAHHAVCVETLRELPGPLLTCWPVLTEAAYLLRRFPSEARRLVASAHSSWLRVVDLRPEDLPPINAILERYEDQGLQLADAALMHLAEREKAAAVFTLDRRDFGVYRNQRGESLVLLPE